MLYAYMGNPGGEVLCVFHYVQFFIPFTIIIKALFFSQRAQTIAEIMAKLSYVQFSFIVAPSLPKV
jgi:hypothetical protein